MKKNQNNTENKSLLAKEYWKKPKGMNHDDRRELELAGFTIEATGRMEAFVEPKTQILIPPKVTLRTVMIKGKEMQFIAYPIPRWWKQPLVGVFLGNLEKYGWKSKPVDQQDLIEDFMRLDNASPEDIASFALRWGPFWKCIQHNDCLWVPEIPIGKRTQWQTDRKHCKWFSHESVEVFSKEAKRVKTVLMIASCLKQKKPVPLELWKGLPGATFMAAGVAQSTGHGWMEPALVAFEVNKMLRKSEGVRLEMMWKLNSQPELAITYRLGFVQLLWLKMAQVITGSTGLYICNGCGKLYVRTLKKPRGRNFCSECGQKVSKKLSARRAKENRQA